MNGQEKETQFWATLRTHTRSSRRASVVSESLVNPTGNREDAGSILGLAQWVEDLALP